MWKLSVCVFFLIGIDLFLKIDVMINIWNLTHMLHRNVSLLSFSLFVIRKSIDNRLKNLYIFIYVVVINRE